MSHIANEIFIRNQSFHKTNLPTHLNLISEDDLLWSLTANFTKHWAGYKQFNNINHTCTNSIPLCMFHTGSLMSNSRTLCPSAASFFPREKPGNPPPPVTTCTSDFPSCPLPLLVTAILSVTKSKTQVEVMIQIFHSTIFNLFLINTE